MLQRTSADLRLNPHVHAVFLDGAWYEHGDELAFAGLGHLRTSEAGEVLEREIRRIDRHLRRRGLLREDPDQEQDPEANLAVSAVSGQAPPAGPQWHVRLAPIERHPLAYDKPMCASQDGFTLHAATHAGALDVSGREALLRYVLRPPIGFRRRGEPVAGPMGATSQQLLRPHAPIAQDKIEPQQDGLIRIVLKRPYADGTVAVDLDPLSLLARLAACVPPPRHHTVRYSGVLAAASPWRSRLAPCAEPGNGKKRRSRYRPWAELLARTFGFDALVCPACQGRMRLERKFGPSKALRT